MSGANYPSLKGKTVVVTGGGSGIGGSITEGFVAQGSRVIFLDIADEDSKALEARLQGAVIPPIYRRCNLMDLAEVEQTFAEIGAVDVLVNNAANDDRHTLEQITPDYWDNRIAVNLRHLVFCAKAVVPAMKAKGAGSIVNVGSVSWHLGIEELVIYQTAKAGIEGLTRALARDLGADGIRVNCVIPGGVQTPRQMKLWHNPQVEADMIAAQCLKSRVMPDDVTAMILFLASDDARMCTAHNYFVDAGWR